MKDVLAMKHVLIGISSNEQARVRLLNAIQQLSCVSDICCLSGLYLNNAASLLMDKSSMDKSLVDKSFADNGTPKYVNGVILLSTSLDLLSLTSSLKQIEASAGGVRAAGICPLDLDIVAFEGESSDLQLRPLPRPMKTEEPYLWTCVQELCPELQLQMLAPEVWQRQLWPEYFLWQVPSQRVSEKVACLLEH